MSRIYQSKPSTSPNSSQTNKQINSNVCSESNNNNIKKAASGTVFKIILLQVL